MKKNIWYVIAGVALAVVVILIVRAKREESKTEIVPTSTNGQSQNENQTSDTFWQGTLETSNNPKNGNLMLVNGKTVIYIHTSRDFTSLIGKEVKVTYQGTMDNFELGDIIAK